MKRFLAALQGEPVDRPPFWFMRQAGRYLPEYREVRVKAGDFLSLCYSPEFALEVTLQPIRRFGFDAAILFSDILVVPHGLGVPLKFVEGEGPVLAPVRDGSAIDALTERSIRPTLDPVYEAVRKISAALPVETGLIGFAGAPWTVATYMVEGGGSRDYLHAKTMLYADPILFRKLINILVDRTAEHLIAQIEAGAEAVQIFDSWALGLDAEGFHDWVIQPTRKLVGQIKAAYPNVPVIGFPRGCGALYLDFVRETGVDAVSLDSNVPLQWAAEVLKPHVVVQGNLDPIALVAGGETMLQRARACIQTLGPDRYVFNLGHGIVPSTPPAHVESLTQALKSGF